MNYFILNEDDSIKFSSNSENALKRCYPGETVYSTSEEIQYGHDGKLYLESQLPPPPPPTLEEQQAAIKAQLDILSAELLPKDYTIVNALAGDAEALAIVHAKRAAHEEAAEPLRMQLHALTETDT